MIISRSQISGAFSGYQSRLTYDLDDGSSWQIVDSRCGFGTGIRPKATVTKTKETYYLKVSGMNGSVEVRPIALPNRRPQLRPKDLPTGPALAYFMLESLRADLQRRAMERS